MKKVDQNVLDNWSASEKVAESRAIYKNVLIISVSFLLLFCAFESMSKLQSSINAAANLGTWANTMIYVSIVISCMFVPSILIRRFKVKWTIVLCVMSYSTYIGAQFYPEFYTLLPTAFLLGMGAAPMWSAKCTYLTHVAHRMAGMKNDEPEVWVNRFFGIFFFFFQCNSVIGDIISTAVLSNDQNATTEITDEEMKADCASNFCPDKLSWFSNDDDEEDDSSDSDSALSTESLYTLAGIYLGCSLAAALVLAVLLDPLDRFGEDERSCAQDPLSGRQLMAATVKHMKQKKQLFIIPLTVWSGVEQGFFSADFTAGFVTCAYGVHIVGRVLICYGICDALSSVTFGYLMKYLGRIPIFLFGAAVNLAVLITLTSWTPTNDEEIVVYVMAGMWGIGDGIWQTQINALYGVLFYSQEEAAFSNYRLWESFGFIIAFITQAIGVCVFPKLIIAMVSLALGMLGYFVVERIIRAEQLTKQEE